MSFSFKNFHALLRNIMSDIAQDSHSTHTFGLFLNNLFYLQGNFTIQEGREESTVSCVDD
jgi:hypothetical protein